MFAKTIVTSDSFLDLPASSRCLYFLLAMSGDDDGFVNNPKSIMRQSGASMDDLNLLIAKRFILTFQSGVVVIKHWKIHNLIQKDRYKETKYLDEKSQLALDENNAYTEAGNTMYPECIQDVSKMDTQVRLVESRVSIGEDNNIYAAAPQKIPRHRYGRYQKVLLSDEDLAKLQEEFPDWEERIERLDSYIAQSGKSYKSHLATIRNWARKDAQSQQKGGNIFLDIAREEGIL